MDSEIRVRLFGTPPFDDWSPQWNNWNYHKDTYKNIKLVLDDSYTHAVVFGLATPDLKVHKSKVLGMACEPDAIYNLSNHVEWVRKHVSKYFCNKPDGLPTDLFIGNFTYLAPMPFIWKDRWVKPEKTKLFSMVASSKMDLPGHRYRHAVIRELLSSDIPVDIYGRGLEHIYRGDTRIKGTVEQKENALLPYMFSIAIENVIEPYFISEKFYDPILCEATPIYWGSAHVKMVFGEDSYLECKNNPKDVVTLLRFLMNSTPANLMRNVSKAKQRMLSQEISMPEFLWKELNKLT